LADGIPKRDILMAYISRSCDFPKEKMGRWVAYIIRLCNQITKKGNTKNHKNRIKLSLKGNFDGLCKQVM
jgi:hypothetical protein